MFQILKYPTYLAVGLVVSVFLGCGGGGSDLEIAPATGTVMLDGAPLPNVIVTFYPEDKGLPASGTTDADGKFSLTTKEPGDGALVGKHRIAVREKPPETGEETTAADYEEKPLPPSKIPANLMRAEQSGLVEEVKASGKNEFLLDLKSK